MYLLGYDIGSSSIKVALVDGTTNQVVHQTQYPEEEMAISSPHPGWAEQHPDFWWEMVVRATSKLLLETSVDKHAIKSIGISYQMHGLVMVDNELQPLRPAIIWCDSRAISQGNHALQQMGHDYCYDHLCNAPGNFTASKLLWVKENEPEIYEQTRYIMLPGDYIAMKMTDQVLTTPSGLSEGILWDFQAQRPATKFMDKIALETHLIPTVTPSFSDQGKLTEAAAAELALSTDIVVGYRAGDQPNNALSLGVLGEGQVAGTGGTSGVIYGVHGTPTADRSDSVNTFAHVNYTAQNPTVGVLLCINGAGSMYRWIKQQIADSSVSYADMEEAIQQLPIGSDGLSVLPFGNGAERMLGNQDIGAQIAGLQLNRHNKAHLYRAGLEGIAFSFFYGIEAMHALGMPLHHMRVGNDNLFQSAVFSQTIANLMEGPIEMVQTTGAIGAARAAGVTLGHFSSVEEAVAGDPIVKKYTPDGATNEHHQAYQHWKNILTKTIKNTSL